MCVRECASSAQSVKVTGSPALRCINAALLHLLRLSIRFFRGGLFIRILTLIFTILLIFTLCVFRLSFLTSIPHTHSMLFPFLQMQEEHFSKQITTASVPALISTCATVV